MCKQSGHDIATMRRHYAEWIQENKEADLRNMAILKAKNEEQSKKLGTNLGQSLGTITLFPNQSLDSI